MLLSSIEYIQALRKGDYLRFLEWPQFLAKHYEEDGEAIDADSTLDFIIFEWVGIGITEEDTQHMAILSAVYELNSDIILPELRYSYTSLYIALIHCLALQKKALQYKYLSDIKLTRKEVVELMKNNAALSDPLDFAEAVSSELLILTQKIAALDKSVVAKAMKSIQSITFFRQLIDDYLMDMEHTENSKDELRQTRISLLESLKLVLKEETKLNEKVKKNIKEYVKKLWECQPEDFEKSYLERLCPPTFLDKIYDFGISFFSSINQEPQGSLSESKKPE